jgi:hypothetical protein
MSEWHRPATHLLLYAFGSVLLFGSWFASNVVGNHWLGELQDRERVLTSITLTELNRAQWLREFNVQIQAKQNRDLIGLAAFHLLAETEQVLADVESLLKDDSQARQQIVAAKIDRVAQAEKTLKKGEMEAVVDTLNKVTSRYEETVVPNTKKAMSRWEAARMSQQKSSYAFIGLYIAGAVLIAFGFVLKEFRSPSSSALQPTAQKKRSG